MPETKRFKNKLWFKMLLIFYLVAYLLLGSMTIGVFFIYKPFSYVDNMKSYILCNKNQAKFEIGPNFIYTLSSSLDSFNDAKARKLCGYNLIKDYGNTLKTPSKINYVFHPVFIVESSWIDALTISILFFLVGSLLFETLRRVVLYGAVRKPFIDNYYNFGAYIFQMFIKLIYP